MTVRERVELAEHDSARKRVPPPSSEDLLLADRLVEGRGQPRLEVKWLHDGRVEVKSHASIGVVRFSSLDVVVTPKLVGEQLNVLRMIEYASGVGFLRRLPADRPLPADGSDLFDLVCLLLTEEAKELLADGLLRDYRPTDDALEVLRGRLRYREQLTRRYCEVLPLECSFDEYDSDMPENQLIAAGLDVARRRAQDTNVRRSALRLSGVLAGVCTPPTLDAGWYAERIQYTRRNKRYESAHELAKLVLRHEAFDDLFDTSDGRSSAFLINMNVLFERFVTRLVREAAARAGLRCVQQRRLREVISDVASGASYATIKPDLVIEDDVTGRSVPVDVKYKLYGSGKVSTADVYQLFTYAYALDQGGGLRRAGLIFPSTTAMTGPILQIQSVQGTVAASVIGAGLDVQAILKALASTDREPVYADVLRMLRDVTGLTEPAALELASA